jgi:ketosteroid isomerase-like protein
MEAEIEAWLRAFAGAVRDRDYATGGSLFASDVIAFGTVAERAVGIETLAARQWRVVWETTRDFDFDYGSVRCEVVGDRAWATSLWTSTADKGPDAGAQRSGRASLVLARDGARWRAVHSHFSLTPRDPG